MKDNRNVNRSQPDGEISRVMKQDWDERAIEDARWYINTLKRDQTDEEFDESGRPDAESFVFADPVFIAGADLREIAVARNRLRDRTDDPTSGGRFC